MKVVPVQIACTFLTHQARLAQSVEHETLNLRVVGSSPTLGEIFSSFQDNWIIASLSRCENAHTGAMA